MLQGVFLVLLVIVEKNRGAVDRQKERLFNCSALHTMKEDYIVINNGNSFKDLNDLGQY